MANFLSSENAVLLRCLVQGALDKQGSGQMLICLSSLGNRSHGKYRKSQIIQSRVNGKRSAQNINSNTSKMSVKSVNLKKKKNRSSERS